MEQFRVLVELLKTSFRVSRRVSGFVLREIESHTGARSLWTKSLDQPLAGRDINSAKAFLARIYDDDSDGKYKNWSDRASQFRALDRDSLAVATVLCNWDTAVRYAAGSIEALCQGAEKVAKWSPWPHDPRLQKLIQQYRRDTVSAADPLARPGESRRLVVPDEPPVLRCCSCHTPLDLGLSYKQATNTDMGHIRHTSEPARRSPARHVWNFIDSISRRSPLTTGGDNQAC
ncbi:hypothetical protein F5144DRAFT_550279 [Chaetomium tenue]|uniref:Uncharacterized protein n=1 Tax=Chaetomium tenue TaxID=1854479 RepID=A0ACB7NWT7_9PEZI|nr:hypothetical protein F5144DRAFT_550279 [Chaetomium globosum]